LSPKVKKMIQKLSSGIMKGGLYLQRKVSFTGNRRSREVWGVILILVILSSISLYGLSGEEWEQRREENLVFHYHPKDRQIIEQTIPRFLNDFTDFQRAIGFYPEIAGDLVIAPDREYYQRVVSGFSGIVEFSEAVYFPGERRIYIRNPRDIKDFSRLRQIVLHEYIHLFLDSLFYNVPLWFHEGMAVFFSADLSFERELIYAKDYLLGNSLTLNEMKERYPAGRIRWDSFYTKSALAVKYLYSSKREEFYSLWDYSKGEKEFTVAFFRAFNMTPTQFSPLFEDQLKRRFRIEMLLAFTGIVWGILPFILLLAWIRKKWRNRVIKKNWDEIVEPVDDDPLSRGE